MSEETDKQPKVESTEELGWTARIALLEERVKRLEEQTLPRQPDDEDLWPMGQP